MNTIVKGKYQHYKGKLYQVIDTAMHTETLETMVIYRALYGDFGLWVRPLTMFLEQIMLNDKQCPRFKLITPD